MAFIHVPLANNFRPVERDVVYGMERMVDMSEARFKGATAVLIVADFSSDLDTPIEFAGVGNTLPTPNQGVVQIGQAQISTPGTWKRLTCSVSIPQNPFPYYGAILTTKSPPGAPSRGAVHVHAEVFVPNA